jgi:hypothetical protein
MSELVGDTLLRGERLSTAVRPTTRGRSASAWSRQAMWCTLAPAGSRIAVNGINLVIDGGWDTTRRQAFARSPE